MAKSIAINLLPTEILTARQRSFKLALVYKVSIILLIVLAVVTSIVLSVRFGQKIRLQQTQDQVKKLEGQIQDLSKREEEIVVVKQRLNSITRLSGGDTQKKDLFERIMSLIPEGMQVTDTSVGKDGNMSITLATASLSLIDGFINAILELDQSTNFIQQVEMENLSMVKGGVYNLLLQIIPKGGNKT